MFFLSPSLFFVLSLNFAWIFTCYGTFGPVVWGKSERSGKGIKSFPVWVRAKILPFRVEILARISGASEAHSGKDHYLLIIVEK